MDGWECNTFIHSSAQLNRSRTVGNKNTCTIINKREQCDVPRPIFNTLSLSQYLHTLLSSITPPSTMPDSTTTKSKLEYGPQICGDLPEIHRFVTGHDSSGKAIAVVKDVPRWAHYAKKSRAYNVLYTTQKFPADMSDDQDVQAHEELLKSGSLGLVVPGGTVLRIVDFAPNVPAAMHRTQSLDYGIVLEGEILMLLDSGEQHHLKRGDVAIQRATLHAWKNPSKDQWCRMAFVLTDAAAPKINGKELREDLGTGLSFLPPSGST